MKRIERLKDVPAGFDLDYVAEETKTGLSHYFTRISLPEGLIRLSNGQNFIGDGEIRMFGLGLHGYGDAKRSTLLSNFSESLESRHGYIGNLLVESKALARLGATKSAKRHWTG